MRRAPDTGRYLRRLAATAILVAARALAVVVLVLCGLTVFARWGMLPGVIVLPVVAALAGVALFVPRRGRASDRRRL